MRICDLKEEDVRPGMVIKSLISDRRGTIVQLDIENDRYAWILWDGEHFSGSGFYGNDCKCEVLEMPKENP